MDIVIVSQYLRNIENLKENNSRFIYLANLLTKDSQHQVEIITSNFMHGEKRKFKEFIQPKNYKITAIDEPGYPTNVCLERIFSHAKLAQNIRLYLNNRKKPDCIYCAIPSLDVAKVVADYCKQNGVRFIIDIQDLWPEAFKMVFKVPIIADWVFAPMEHKANKIYAQADEIIAVSQTYCNRALRVNKKCKTTSTVFLGTRLADYDNNAKTESCIKLPEESVKLAYCGTLGSSYDLTCVIDALKILQEKNVSVPTFIIMGDGPRRKEFEEYTAKKNVDAIFTGRLDYSEMCALLNVCDIVVNPIVAGSAASIINKHADYAACGLPVLNTQESEEYRNLVEDYSMGFNCNNGDACDLAEKLIKLINDKELCHIMGKNARRCAEERFDREYTYREIVKLIIQGDTL